MTGPEQPSEPDGSRNYEEDFAGRITQGDAALFIGAGVSVGSGLPDWERLVRDLAHRYHVDLPTGIPPWNMAQYIANTVGDDGANEIRTAIRKDLTANAEPTNTHRQIAHLGLEVLWTSNYDELLERAYEKWHGKGHLNLIRNSKELVHSARTGPATLYKLHGSVDGSSKLVLTRQDYARYRVDNEGMYTALLNDLLSRTFTFIGFSFVDPNMMGLLDEAARISGDCPRRHYAIFGPEDREGPDWSLRVMDLKGLGILPVYVTSWDELPVRLEGVRRAVLRQRVLVSGSARSERPDQVPAFAEEVGRMLIETGYTVVTGLNEEVGRAVINGALVALTDASRQSEINERVLIWPLPRDDHRRRSELRRAMASAGGVGLFIGGASGTQEEYDAFTRASEEGSGYTTARDDQVIPVGAFGGTGRDLWKDLRTPFLERHGKLADDFEALKFDEHRAIDKCALVGAVKRILQDMTGSCV